MTITNIFELSKNLDIAIDNVIEFNDSITVNTKKGKAVIISEEEYNSLLESIHLASHKDLIIEGEKENISDMSTYNPNEEW